MPPPGSVIESANTHSPRVIRGRKNSFCASLPKKPIDLPPKHTVLKYGPIAGSPRTSSSIRIAMSRMSPPEPP